MQTFHNDNKIKEKYVSRVKKHFELDEIIQGKYWENGKGCAVGCTIQDDDPLKTGSYYHQRFEEALGIPRVIARLEDRIFEGLSNKEAKEFPLRFIESVNVGADLSMVMPKFFVWLLGDKDDGVIKYAKGYKKTEKAIKDVLKLYQDTVGGKLVKKESWIKIRAAAAAAYAAYAADAAAAAAYAAAADAAADAAAYAADAAAAYAYDAARKTARQEYYSKMANKLIEILKETK